MFGSNKYISSEEIKKLKEEQKELAKKVVIKKPDFEIKKIAGCDSSFIGDKEILSFIVIFNFPSFEILETQHTISEVTLPYIPGLLAFRESPNILKTYEKLQNEPDILMVDGHGISHPRGLGIASHIGVLLNKPSIGVAKKVLVGKFEEPCLEKGCKTPLIYKDKHIADALRKKEKVKPVFISVGNLFDQQSAVNLALQTSVKYRLPEPVRITDQLTKSLKLRSKY